MATMNLTADNFKDTVMAEGIVLVDCWAAWCGPCRQFGPIFEAAADRHEDVTFAKVDTEAERSIAEQLQITSIPTVMAFRDGHLVFRESGALPASAMDDLVAAVKNLDMTQVTEKAAAQGS